MPLYEYECADCRNRFEVRQRVTDEPITVCPTCGGPCRKVLFPAGIIFKGSGWYITDNRKSDSASTNGHSKSETSADAKTEKKSETKSESKSESKSDSAATTSSSSGGSESSKSTTSSPN